MDCLNETVMIHCLQQICFDHLMECSGAGGSVAAGIIVTGLIAAAISVIIHLALHIWFYKPRMGRGRNGAKKMLEEAGHEYETIYEEGKKTVTSIKEEIEEKEELSTKLSKNVAYFTRAAKKTKI